MNHASIAGLENQGIASLGPMPAGMLRIRKDHQEKYIWPVHLPGWLSMGWRVAGAEIPSIGVADAEPSAPIATTAGELVDQDEAKPASPRGRRGRRRKDEALPVEPADTGTVSDKSNSDAMGPEPNSESAQQTDPPAAGGTEPDPDSDSAADPSPDAELVLTVLPDDLFDDPLI